MKRKLHSLKIPPSQRINKQNYGKVFEAFVAIEKFLVLKYTYRTKNNSEMKSMNHTIHLIRFPFFISYFLLKIFFKLAEINQSTLSLRSTLFFFWNLFFFFVFQIVDAFYLLKTFWRNVKSVSSFYVGQLKCQGNIWSIFL